MGKISSTKIGYKTIYLGSLLDIFYGPGKFSEVMSLRKRQKKGQETLHMVESLTYCTVWISWVWFGIDMIGIMSQIKVFRVVGESQTFYRKIGTLILRMMLVVHHCHRRVKLWVEIFVMNSLKWRMISNYRQRRHLFVQMRKLNFSKIHLLPTKKLQRMKWKLWLRHR